ncbi:MAG: DNA (cytosine-5-)-methyltransferase [Microthrixaceae bacterium]
MSRSSSKRGSPLTSSDLRRIRKEAGISQFRLARAVGVSSQDLSAWERGESEPSEQQLELILRTLGSIESLVESGQIRRGRRPTPVAHDAPQAPGVSTDCCGPTESSQRRPTALALFAGCGGLALGFQNAGFNVRGFVELDPAARSTFKRNLPSSQCFGHDILDLHEHELDVIRHTVGELDVLIGGPPCQGFSLAGKRSVEDERNELYKEYARCATQLRPKVLLMENVRLLMSMKNRSGGFVIDDIRSELENAGYETAVFELNAQDYGVPQFRERVFVLGRDRDWASDSFRLCPPGSTHGVAMTTDSLFADDLAPYATFRSATLDLQTLESGERSASDPLHWGVKHPEHVINWLRDVPEGRSAHDNEDPDMRPPSGYNTTYKRIRWDEPSSTIGTTFGMISGSRNVHPESTRSLTVREAARCQTFPDHFEFEGTWGQIRTMLGNAVPPLLAEAWARHIGGSLSTDDLERDRNTQLLG